MNYNIKPIPTKYNGIQFRSRLEATWAAFFDNMGWSWNYEPFDLNGWTPDFLLKSKIENILVEVKPITSISDFIHTQKKYLKEELKFNSGYNCLVLGTSPQWVKSTYYENQSGLQVGWMNFYGEWENILFHGDGTNISTCNNFVAPLLYQDKNWKVFPETEKLVEVHQKWLHSKNQVMFLKPNTAAA